MRTTTGIIVTEIITTTPEIIIVITGETGVFI
jgi:hypothetical protein